MTSPDLEIIDPASLNSVGVSSTWSSPLLSTCLTGSSRKSPTATRPESADRLASARTIVLTDIRQITAFDAAHGEDDRTVPAKFGKALFAAANEPKQAMFMPGLTHKTIYDPAVQAAILAFINQLPHDHVVNGQLMR